MIKQLKHLLINIARLSLQDQQWILQRLTPAQRITFKKWDGLKLLNDAQRFRTLRPYAVCSDVAKPLPAYCQQLAAKPPLYAAIIMEQGSYPWKNLFLEQFDSTGAIQKLLHHEVTAIKPQVRAAVFNEWKQSLSFESHLDTLHG